MAVIDSIRTESPTIAKRFWSKVAKLSNHQVVEIRAIKGMTQTAIALRYRVSQVLIGLIQKRRIWTHVT